MSDKPNPPCGEGHAGPCFPDPKQCAAILTDEKAGKWWEQPHTHGGTDCAGGDDCPMQPEPMETQNYVIGHLPIAMRNDMKMLESYADNTIHTYEPGWERTGGLYVKVHREHVGIRERSGPMSMLTIEFTIQRKKPSGD